MKKHFKNIADLSLICGILFFIYAFLVYGFEFNLILLSVGIFIVLDLLISVTYLIATKAFRKDPNTMMEDIKRGIDDGLNSI
jgi:hypothetical protein